MESDSLLDCAWSRFFCASGMKSLVVRQLGMAVMHDKRNVIARTHIMRWRVSAFDLIPVLQFSRSKRD